MKTSSLVAVVCFASVPVAAQTVSFDGARLSYSRVSGSDFDYDMSEFEGSVEIGVGPAFSAQLDLSGCDYSDDPESYSSAGLHLIYDITPKVSVGAFYVEDDWGTLYTNYGIEGVAAFEVMSGRELSIEGFSSRYSEKNGSDYAFDAVGFDAEFGIASGFSVSGGLTDLSGDERFLISRVGLKYEHRSGVYGQIEAIHLEPEFGTAGDAIALTLGFNFKDGTTFQQRKWVDSLVLY